MGWRRGFLAAGLVLNCVPDCCLGRCSALWVCARRSPQVARAGLVPPLVPPTRPRCPFLAFLAVLVAACPVGVSLVLACWYAIPCGLCVLRARSGCPFGARRVFVMCLCAPASAVVAYPPLPSGRGMQHRNT